MSVRSTWRVVETPGWDIAGARSYVVFNETGSDFALDCLTGSIHGACDGNSVEFRWTGSDEMEPTSGTGWAQVQEDGSLVGEICMDNGDEIPFIARPASTSSTAC